MGMQFNTTKRWHKKFEPRVHVWKLKEEETCEEYQSMVKDKVVDAEWKYFVNERWQQMKTIMMDTAQVTCGSSKGPCTHEETWWWNEEVAEAVNEKKKSTEIGRKKNQQRHGRSRRRVNKTQKELSP